MLRDVKPFQDAVLAWYRAHRRELPWRGEADPYRVLLSEVLLQQTRVEQAIPYYHRFLEAFPTLQALAEAPEEAVLKAWEGAGYYARARNLKRLAEATPHGLPRTYRELLALPGVGPYTAAAVASIAFGEPVAAVDGNVRRVLARLFAVQTPRPAWLQETANALLARAAPGEWNQALMELGATTCTPRAPACRACPAARWCRGRATPERYPAPKPRRARSVQAAALVLAGQRGYVLERRDGTSLGGLWGFPWPRARTPSSASSPATACARPGRSGRCGTPSRTRSSPSRCGTPPPPWPARTPRPAPSRGWTGRSWRYSSVSPSRRPSRAISA